MRGKESAKNGKQLTRPKSLEAYNSRERIIY